MPYLFRNSIETSELGIPAIRSMVVEFTSDPTCGYLDKQYMLGDSLLVAPIFNDEGMASYYLPEGRWTDYFTGEVKEGSRWYQEKHGYLSIPLMVKENSLLAIGARDDDAVYDYADGVILKAYELMDGTPSTTKVYDEKANLAVKAEIIKKDNTIRIRVESDKPYTVVLVNRNDIILAENATYEVQGNDTIIRPVKLEKLFVLK